MKKIHALAGVAVLSLASLSAQAHKRWFLPTDFSLSEAETVTVDFTASNNLFYVDKAMPVTGVKVLSPRGSEVEIANAVMGARRSSFDLEVSEEGTYRVYDGGYPMYFVSYQLPGEAEPVRKRGPLQKLKAGLPENASEVKYALSTALIETYVTLGADSKPAALPVNDGLSLELLSHPNTLYVDEPAEFRVLLDGTPAAGIAVTVIPEGTRYRDSQGELEIESDAHGLVVVEWPTAGRFLLEMDMQMPQPGEEVGMRFYGYFLTVEVLAP